MSKYSRPPQFNPEDVWAVARALGDGVYIDEGGRTAYRRCSHCDASEYHDWRADDTLDGSYARNFKHKPNCPVFIARDLLTGAPKPT